MKAWTILVAAALLAATAIACDLEDEEESAPPLSGSASNASPTPRPGFARVGSVEIQVLAIEAVDASSYNALNQENLRVRVRVQKIKGDTYDFAVNQWILVFSRGTGIEASMFCVACPEAIHELVLYGNQPVEAYVYFEVPAGAHTFVELRYEPFFSGNKGKIPLQFDVTIN